MNNKPAVRRPGADSPLRLADVAVPDRLPSPTERRMRARRISPRRSLGLDDAEGLEQLKRKLSEVENPPEHGMLDRLVVCEDWTSRMNDCDLTAAAKKRPTFHHILHTSPVREPSPHSPHHVNTGHVSSETAAASLSVSGGDITSSCTRRLSPSRVSPGRPLICLEDDAAGSGDVARTVTSHGVCRRQMSHPQGRDGSGAAAAAVEEISSEQWEELVFTPAGRPQPAIVQEVDTDSDGGSDTPPGTPTCVSELRLPAGRSGVQIVEEETLHFAAEEHEQWGDEEGELTPDLPSPAPEHGSPGVMEGACERAVFCMLRPYGSVLRPTVGCLSPMPEEEEDYRDSCDDDEDWDDSESEPSTVKENRRGEPQQGGSASVDCERRAREARESFGRSDTSAVQCSRENVSVRVSGVNDDQSESLPVEVRTRDATLPGHDNNNNGLEGVSVRVSDDGHTIVGWSLPNEARLAESAVHNRSAPQHRTAGETDDDSGDTAIVNEAQSSHDRSQKEGGGARKRTDKCPDRSASDSESSSSELDHARRKRDSRFRDSECASEKINDSFPTDSSNQPPASGASESVEVVDRTSDRKYNFTSLRMKRQQAAQQTSKTQKNAKAKPKQDGRKPSDAQAAHAAGAESTDNRFSLWAFKMAVTPRRGTEVAADLGTDLSWRTVHQQPHADVSEGTAHTVLAEPPSLVTRLQDVEMFMSSSLVLTAEVRGTPAPSVRWIFKPFLYMDAAEVHTGTEYLVQRQRRGDRHRLVVPRLKYLHAGVYTLTATNSAGAATSQCKVTVRPISELSAPVFFTPLVNRRVHAGAAVTFRTEVRGDPRPTVSWYRNGALLQSSEEVILQNNKYTAEAVLHLPSARPGDDGVYICRATNEHGTAQRKVALAVEQNASQMAPAVGDDAPVPVFSARLGHKRRRVKTGDTLVLSAALNPTNTRTFRWRVADRELVHSERVKTDQDADGFVQLVVEDVGVEDAGNYQLIVDLEGGAKEVSAVDVYVAGDDSDEGEATEITGNSIKPGTVGEEAPGTVVEEAPGTVAEDPPASGGLAGWLHHLPWRREPPQPLPTPPAVRSGEPVSRGEPAMESDEVPLEVAAEDAAPVQPPQPEEVQPAETGETVAASERPVVESTPPPVAAVEASHPADVRETPAPEESPAPAALSDQTPADATTTPETAPAAAAPASAGTPTPAVAAPTPEDPPAAAGKTVERRRSSAVSTSSRRRSSALAADAEPPAVEAALSSVRAVVGCPARLEGRLSGRPRPLVAWYHNGSALTPDGARVKAYHEEDGTFGLEIGECQLEDGGQYAAEATNALGAAATDAELELLDMSVSGKEWAPDFTTPLLGGTFDEGGAIELDTHVTGVPIPEICWSKDGVPLEGDERVTTAFDSDKATLSVKDAVPADAGTYEIAIRNSLGEAASSVEVKVKKIYQMPLFTEELRDVDQTFTMDAKLSCTVTGVPSPEVHWLKNGAPLAAGAKYKMRRDQAACTCTLTVRDCDEQDGGLYTCRASNREGGVETTATLRIVEKLERKPKLEAPLFLKTLGDCEVFPGMQARFTACLAGYPLPEAEWYRNDVRLYPSDRIQMEADATGLVRLTLRQVDETDAGRYRLSIRNSEGDASCQADLTYDSFELSPTKPLSQQYRTLEKELNSGIPMQLAEPPIISKMVDRQLTLSWKPSATAGQRVPPTYIVEMAKMPEGDFGIVHHGVRGCSVEIKRLEPGCDYKFRVIAENKHGASDPSPHVIAHRRDLLPAPEDPHPTLPDGEPFKPSSSPLFPKGFNMETHTAGRPQPPTVSVTLPTPEAQRADDDSWRYDRYDPEAGAGGARPASQRAVPPFPDSYHPPAGAPERPGDPRPAAARLRPLTDDVDGYVPAAGGRHRRQQHGEEWEQRRGSNIIERLMVRKQMEEAAKSFTRSAGLESRGLMRLMKPRGDRASDRIALERRLNHDDDDEVEVRPTPVRSVRPPALSDDDEEDVPVVSRYTPARYPRPPSEPRQTRARSILDDEEDDDEIYTTYRRPAHHARTASLIAAANHDTGDDDDDDVTPYLRRPPRFLGSRDWGAASQRARSPRPAVSALDRDIQERRERHAELISSRQQAQNAAPPPPPAPVSDWQSEFDRYMKNLGSSKSAPPAAARVAAKPVATKPKDLTSVRDWESRFNAHV